MKKHVPVSIIEHFSELVDPRMQKKMDHKLMDIVVIALCAVLCGADGMVEIEIYGKEKEDWLSNYLELPNGIPSHDTFGWVFALLDPAEFSKCFSRWIRDVFALEDPGVIAMDGKTARRSHDRANGKGPIHVVSAWAVKNHLILGQEKTEEKSNEIKAIPELLQVLDLKGSVITIDAMGCQREIVKQIRDQGGDYVISLKGNLHKEVKLLFETAEQDEYRDLAHDTHSTIDGDHGRVETRCCTTIGDGSWFEDLSKWPGLTTVGKVESRREIGDELTEEPR